MSAWIDFNLVKEAARPRFGEILERYGLAATRKGSELLLRCPFHEEEKPSCRVNTERGIFHCFGCGAKGNVLDFVAKKEAVSIKKAAELVGGWFGIAPGKSDAKKGGGERKKAASAAKEGAKPASEQGATSAAPATSPAGAEGSGSNKPLTFTLQLDSEHPYLAERGLAADVVQTFGLGFCSRGVLKGRIAIPIHDEEGRLVAYAGRWPGRPPESEERYKLPAGFRKAEVLFNLHRVAGAEALVVVEGFFPVFRLHALRIPSVALTGTALSERQEALIAASHAKRVTLLMDGDDAGRAAAAAIAPRLARHVFVRIAELAHGEQPDTAAEETLTRLLTTG